MATSRPMDAHQKKKSSSASSVPHHTDTVHRRRTTRPSVPGSPDGDPHRRPAASKSSAGISRARGQPPSNATAGRRAPTRSPSADKSPSPSGPPRRATTPNPLKGKTVVASPSAPGAAVSPKPASDKASKPLKSTKAQPLVKTATSFGAYTRKVAGAPTPPGKTEAAPAIIKSEREQEPEIQVEQSEPVDILEVNDDSPDELDLTESSEPNMAEDTTDSASQTDQHEPSSPKPEVEIATSDGGVRGDGNKADEDKESAEEPEEKPAMESSEEPKSEPVVDGGKPEEDGAEKATAAESNETKRPEVAATGRKKDAPRSNDVIEEARSKLIEKRRSKVLALVGAFETVISLQEPEGQSGQPQGKSGDAGA